jgi:hypothetical protein
VAGAAGSSRSAFWHDVADCRDREEAEHRGCIFVLRIIVAIFFLPSSGCREVLCWRCSSLTTHYAKSSFTIHLMSPPPSVVEAQRSARARPKSARMPFRQRRNGPSMLRSRSQSVTGTGRTRTLRLRKLALGALSRYRSMGATRGENPTAYLTLSLPILYLKFVWVISILKP